MPLAAHRTCVCGVSLAGTHGGRRFCSARCRNREKERRDHGSAERWAGRVCVCGATFDAEIRPGAPARKCPACRAADERSGRPLRSARCAMCRTPFETPHPTKLFCSSSCGERARGKRRRSTTVDRRGRSGRPWRRIRRQVLDEESTCWICGLAIDPVVLWPDRAAGTVDHVVPLSDGGHPTDRSNLRAAHFVCNVAREHNRRRRARRAA